MRRAATLSLAVWLSACSALPSAVPVATTTTTQRDKRPIVPPETVGGAADREVEATFLRGHPQTVVAGAPPAPALRGGDVNLDFPNVDVQAVAKAVLGEILSVPYSIAPDIHTPITLQPGRRIARSEVLPALENALRVAGLALTPQAGGGYAILPVDQARAVAPVGESSAVGFGSEAIPLHFVNAEQLRKLIDPVLPGVVTGADPIANVLTVAGTEGQRAAARDLVRQFDVDWLRGTSFALFIPHRTDARLIVPELDKVLNADDAPTRNMVRLIAMDRLNGILAVSVQPQYLDDTRRWVEVLDREGENSTRRIFVYRVQNGRASDLARTLGGTFGQGAGGRGHPGGLALSDTSRPPGVIGVLPTDGQGGQAAPSPGAPPSGLGGGAGAAGPSGSSSGFGNGGALSSAPGPGGGVSGEDAGGTSVELQADDFHVRMTSDEVNNAIVVYASPREYAVIEEALRQLDVPPSQVMIEAAITEVTLTDALRFGVQGLYNNHNTSVGLTESAASALPIQTFPGFSAFYAAKTVSAAVNALENLTTVNVVSAPKLMVLNNQTASIEVGSEVPILTGSATSVLTSGAPVVNSVDYRNTGIILKVTPRVNSSGTVLLDLAQEVSDVVAAGASSTINSPSFSTRRIATSVAVHDGEVIALGGLISDNRNDQKNGLPILSRIPVLGPLLFGNINNNDMRTELIVLLRPVVVRNVDDGRAVTEELREKLRELRGLLPPGRIQ